MKKRIYIDTWLELKPYSSAHKTDLFYLKLANEVKTVLADTPSSMWLFNLNEEDLDLFACFLISYLEDVISDIKLWQTFVKCHKNLYDTYLPFYTTIEYFEDEINEQDVQFLIWYFLNCIQKDLFISPYSDFIQSIGREIFKLLDKAWDYAPENDHLQSYYRIAAGEKDYYLARQLMDRILFQSYLFYFDTTFDLFEQESEVAKEMGIDENLHHYLQESRDLFLHSCHTKLIAFSGKEWAGEVLGESHSLFAAFKEMSPRIWGYFFYKGQDEHNVHIEHVASGMPFNMTKKSFDFGHELKDIDALLHLGIVQWMGEWWFSGVFIQSPFNADIVLDEKNSISKRSAVNFLNKPESLANVLADQGVAFRSCNDGSDIAFMPVADVSEFIEKFIDVYNDRLNVSERQLKEGESRRKNDGYFDGGHDGLGIEEIDEIGLVYFNPKSGAEIAIGINSAFPLTHNSYYNEMDSEDDIMYLFISPEFSKELVMFCVDNCKDDIPFLNKGNGKLYLNDLDFLLRYWKAKNYHTRGNVSFV